MHLDAVLAAAFARRDDGSLSAPWLEDQDGISLLCQLLYERSTAGRAYLFIAVTDEGHLRVVRLLVLYQKMQAIRHQPARWSAHCYRPRHTGYEIGCTDRHVRPASFDRGPAGELLAGDLHL